MTQLPPPHKSRPAPPGPNATRTGVVTHVRRLRFFYVLAFFAFWASIICLRLVWLQVIEHHKYTEQAARQQQRTFEVAPRRGILYDRNLHPLAMTVLVDSIYAVPSQMTDSEKITEANALARVVHTDADDSYTSAHRILARLRASRNFAWVARKQDKSIVARVKALKLKGVYFQKEFKRFYPDNVLAAQVLGYVGIDDTGLGGVEQEFDSYLHGVPGRMLTAIDARRHVLGSAERDPQPGDNLVLTLDANIQFMAEQALDHAMERTKALTGTIVVQDPHTGQILALAIRPTFNPNEFRHTTRALLRDNAVSDVFEPGSTFKLVTYSSALDDKVVTPQTMLNTLGGKITVAGRVVHDDRDAVRYEAHYNNVISATQALEQSSDVAAVELAERMGKDTFYKYIRAFGFGQKTGIELPGETRGLLKPPDRWQPTTIGSIPMGQEVAVTPIQLVSMVSTIANGGVYLPPHILLESSDETKNSPALRAEAFHPENEVPDPLPEGAHRVISTYTAAEMHRMMEGVVEQGTGIPAQLNGYSAAGKTGTAEKIDVRTHTYSKTKYVASFVGFAPVNNPAITIAVVMDSPAYQFHYGTQASAPVFRELAQEVLEYLGVPHDEELKSASELAKEKQAPAPEEQPSEPLDDLNSLFSAVNDLPADDPLRASDEDGKAAVPVAKDTRLNAARSMSTGPSETGQKQPEAPPALPAKTSPKSETGSTSSTVVTKPSMSPRDSVVVNSAQRVTVPSFLGLSVRKVVEEAGREGLGVRLLGTGLAREQVPAPGTKVPVGTEVVVRFSR